MKNLADCAARMIAIVAAAGITALTIFTHAAYRAQLGAPDVVYAAAARATTASLPLGPYASLAQAGTQKRALN